MAQLLQPPARDCPRDCIRRMTDPVLCELCEWYFGAGWQEYKRTHYDTLDVTPKKGPPYGG